MTAQTTARDRAEVVERALKMQEGSVLAREVLRLRALAGAPTADVANLPTRFRAAAEAAARQGFDALAAHLSEAAEYLRLPGRVEAIGRALLAAPEGVDPADELARLRKRVNMLEVNWQGEQIARDEYMEEARRLADELAAAQAAIQRVRAVVEKAHLSYPAAGLVNEIRRALDGDTTEEG